MSMIKSLEDKVSGLADSLDYKRVLKESDSIDNNKSYESDLNIPIIGGLLYMYHSYRDAQNFMRMHTKKLNMQRHIVDIIKDEEIISRSIRHQLDGFLDTRNVSIIEVPPKHMSKFKKVIAEYGDTITWSSRPDGKIVLVKIDDE